MVGYQPVAIASCEIYLEMEMEKMTWLDREYLLNHKHTKEPFTCPCTINCSANLYP